MDKPVQFLSPKSFDPLEFLPGRLMLDADFARWIMSLVLTKLSRVKDRGYVRLHSKVLETVMGRKRKPILDALLDSGAIERVGSYVRGRQTYGYRPGQRFLADTHVRRPVTHPKLAAALRKHQEEKQAEVAERVRPIHRHLGRLQRRLDIEVNQAAEVLRSLPPESNPYDAQGILTADITERHWRLSVGRWGRVANNITSLKRELRRTLRVDRSPLASIDISCCQPGLLAYLITHPKFPSNGPKGCRTYVPAVPGGGPRDALVVGVGAGGRALAGGRLPLFRDLAGNGELYDFLGEKLAAGSEMPRDVLKRKFLADVLAKKKANRLGDEYPSEVENIFRAEFPEVYRWIRSVNRDGWEHSNLIRLLQRAESHLVVDHVCGRLKEQHPKTFAVTLHDAIYTEPRNVEVVRKAFVDSFDDLGIAMSLKVETP